MRKKLLGLVMAALVIGTAGAFAQNENPASSPVQTCQNHEGNGKECKKHKECKKGEKGDRKGGKGEQRDKKQIKRPMVNPFAGINLTPEQQQQVEKLRSDRKERKAADKEANKEAKKQAKAQERQQYEAELAKILTPEQMAQYKNNCDSLKKMQKRQPKDKGLHKGKRK